MLILIFFIFISLFLTFYNYSFMLILDLNNKEFDMNRQKFLFSGIAFIAALALLSGCATTLPKEFYSMDSSTTYKGSDITVVVEPNSMYEEKGVQGLTGFHVVIRNNSNLSYELTNVTLSYDGRSYEGRQYDPYEPLKSTAAIINRSFPAWESLKNSTATFDLNSTGKYKPMSKKVRLKFSLKNDRATYTWTYDFTWTYDNEYMSAAK